MVTTNQIEAGAVKFIDNVIAPNIPTNVPNGKLKKFAFLAGAAYAVHKGVQQYANLPVLSGLLPALSELGAVDAEGNVDLDGILEAARSRIPAEGLVVNVPILGDLTFDAADLDRLAAYIKEA